MIKNTIQSLLICMVVTLLPSCVKYDLYDTQHPQTGIVTIIPDWTDRSADAEIPSSYILEIGETHQEVSGASNSLKRTFIPGNYELTAYNIPQGMTLYGTEISVNAAYNGLIDPCPEHLFLSGLSFDVTADSDTILTMPMTQYTRRLELILSVAEEQSERIASATGTLSGICGSVDIATGTRSDNSSKTATDAVLSSDKLCLSYNLLGIAPAVRQTLTVTVTFTNGDKHTIESDLTEMLASFGNGHSTMQLTGELLLPVEDDKNSSFSGSINDWQIADGGNTDAH